MRSLVVWTPVVWTLALALCACGDDDGPGTDAGMNDVGTFDAGADDAGADDAGADDAGANDASADDASADDAGADDAGADDASADASGGDGATDDARDPCLGISLGDSCSESARCATPYICDVEAGRCVPPSDRMICGGIVGAMCTTRTFPECTLVSGASGGPCLSTLEDTCVCRDHADVYDCRSRM